MTDDKTKTIAGIEISHPEKIYFPEANITKAELALYYHEHAQLILPHLTNHPLTVFRCPEGVGKECFFQKHFEAIPKGLDHILIKEKDAARNYLVIKNEANLITLVQNAVLEFHTWGCPATAVEKPDRIVFDLDPASGIPFADIIECAKIIRAGLQELDLQSFVKTSGKKGLHVYIPLPKGNTWAEVKQFSQGFSKHMEKLAPNLFTSNISKSKRAGKILIDYLRNDRGATCVAAYSTRATPKAGISTPLSWDELGRLNHSDQYTLQNINKRLAQLTHDPWQEYFKVKQTLPKKFF